ncbi:LysR family transcriptional regulator [Xylophilus sp.]|uniref:LysR family transcriptional regulator n=1 Tax=Xylophilus sp. TaxID=2653893 RepID=UPI0013BB3704|nr:LysR family transcriptional regulator [Xylophilus sp.]KAF1047513.1 MAG: HTH-type transcriptional regulator GltC [Xylophilus sp.]
MKLQALSTLTAVVETGSFAAAAERVNLTPSAVSLQMKQLEQYFRQPLFDRSGRNARPTPFAAALCRTVERAVADIDAMRLAPDHVPAGRVRLGVTDSALTTLLPGAFALLQERAPQVALVVGRGTTPTLLQQLKAGDIDVAVLIRPPSGGSSRLRWTDLLVEEFVLLAPAALPAGNAARLLRTQPWIRLDHRVIAGQIAADYVQAQVPGKPALIELPGMDPVVAMVGMGLGVSVVPRPRHQLLDAYPVQALPLGAGGPRRHLAMARRAADVDRRAFDVVEQAFGEVARALPGSGG